MESDESLAAFMSGVEFVLLAFEGRLRSAGLDAASGAKLEAFVADYRRVLEQYRSKDAGRVPPPPPLLVLAAMSPRHN